jgi:serine/threonine protein kinase
MIQYTQDDPYRIPNLFIAETRICEIVKKHPHPNIARYFGCVVQKDRIVGLCLAKYHMTLEDKLNGDLPVPRDILKGIERGLNHLHNLGLIHNDINPSNIMFKANDDTPIIIDFDSCGKEGDKLVKAGTMGWSDDGFDFATVRNDYYGLKKIEHAISGPIIGSSSRYV